MNKLAHIPIVPENEEGPKHRPLRDPIERPHDPAIDVGGGGGEPDHHGDVPDHVAHRAPRVLHPAALRYRRADLGEPERGRGPRIEPLLVPGAPADPARALLPLLLEGDHPQRRAHAERPVPVDRPRAGAHGAARRGAAEGRGGAKAPLWGF